MRLPIEPPPTSAPIGTEVEGTWIGALHANGTELRFVLIRQPAGDLPARVNRRQEVTP